MRQTLSVSYLIAIALALLVAGCSQAPQTLLDEALQQSLTEEQESALADILARMPAPDEQEQIWLNKQIMEMGPAGIRGLTEMLLPAGSGDDTSVRYAVSGLAKHVSGPEGESGRPHFEEVLLVELQSGRSRQVKAFLMRQLELTAGDRSVPVMEYFLNDDGLILPAIDVLKAVDSPAAAQALHRGLSSAESGKRVPLIKALGEMSKGYEAADFIAYAADEQWQVRRVALHALAATGQPAAVETFQQVVDTTGTERRAEVLSRYLMFAERLADEGHDRQAAQIARQVLEGSYPVHFKRSALKTLADAEGGESVELLITLAKESPVELRYPALSLAASFPGLEVTEALVAELQLSSPPFQADLVSVLGERGDRSALQAVLPYLESDNRQVRLAAIETVALLGDGDNVSDLTGALHRSGGDDEIDAIRAALLQMPSDVVTREAAEALPQPSDPGKAALIQILAERRAAGHLELVLEQLSGSGEKVRANVFRSLEQLAAPEDVSRFLELLPETRTPLEREALQDAIVALTNRVSEPERRDEPVARAVEHAPANQKPALLEILPRIGGLYGLGAVVVATDSPEPSVRQAAIHALAGWPDARASGHLLGVLDKSDPSDRTKVLEGYLRLASGSDYTSDEQVQLFQDAVSAAQTPQETEMVFEAIAGLRQPAALQVAASYFSDGDETVRSQALGVASRLLASSYLYESGSFNNALAVLAVLAPSERTALTERIEEQIGDLRARSAGQGDPADEEIYQPAEYRELFNGENLDGWEQIGERSGQWRVSGGILYTDGGGSGWLSTTQIYDDYRLELEYRVPEGGNSGVFLRAPREGNPAYMGMEIQILDDYAERYSGLEPWQYTGSIYNVKAPSDRVSKPAGEWQEMVIVADGPNIRVKLNGEMILNTNLIHHMHRTDDHPGLKRRQGYIGLQNHSSRIEFRNIKISEL